MEQEFTFQYVANRVRRFEGNPQPVVEPSEGRTRKVVAPDVASAWRQVEEAEAAETGLTVLKDRIEGEGESAKKVDARYAGDGLLLTSHGVSSRTL